MWHPSPSSCVGGCSKSRVEWVGYLCCRWPILAPHLVPQALPGVIPVCRGRNNFLSTTGCSLHQKNIKGKSKSNGCGLLVDTGLSLKLLLVFCLFVCFFSHIWWYSRTTPISVLRKLLLVVFRGPYGPIDRTPGLLHANLALHPLASLPASPSFPHWAVRLHGNKHEEPGNLVSS